MIFSLITLMIRANLDFKGDIILIKVGIVGGTGYTGAELLRILVQHPNVELCVITSRTESGKRVDALFPNLRGACDLVFSAPSNSALSRCDLVFFATPHGTAQSMMKPLISAGVRVVDLSADFRLKDIALWERWYGQKHSCPDLVGEAVYGLPEVNRDHLPSAQLVACPGCYPTSVQLGLLPLLRAGWIDTETIIVNAASGISGAGKSANTSLLMAENYDSFRAYSVSGHRHLPEIEQGLAAIRHGGDPQPQGLNVTFVPHLLPIVRGIHSTIYVRTNDSAGDIQQLYESTYSDTIFVDVLPNGQYPETRTVKGTNLCRVGVENPQEKGMLVIMSVIDNLAKGASTQAVQNMNLMFGWDEDLAINFVAVLP